MALSFKTLLLVLLGATAVSHVESANSCTVSASDGTSEQCFSLWANGGYWGDRDAGTICVSITHEQEFSIFVEATGYYSMHNLKIWTGTGTDYDLQNLPVVGDWFAGAQTYITRIPITETCAETYTQNFIVYSLVGELCTPFHADKPWIWGSDLDAYATSWTNYTAAKPYESVSISCECEHAPTAAPTALETFVNTGVVEARPTPASDPAVDTRSADIGTLVTEAAPSTPRTSDPKLCVNKDDAAASLSGTSACFPLQTVGEDQTVIAGQVCATFSPEGDKMTLTMKANTGYELLKNQVWAGTSLDSLPTKDSVTVADGGLPNTAAFPDYACDFTGIHTTQWTDALPANICASAEMTQDTIVLVAHSIVGSMGAAVSDASFTAFGYEQVAPGGFAYMDFTVLCDCV